MSFSVQIALFLLRKQKGKFAIKKDFDTSLSTEFVTCVAKSSVLEIDYIFFFF